MNTEIVQWNIFIFLIFNQQLILVNALFFIIYSVLLPSVSNYLYSVSYIFHVFSLELLTFKSFLLYVFSLVFPPNIYLLKVNNRIIRLVSNICSKSTIKTPSKFTDVVLVSLLTLDRFHTWFWCLHCWLRTSKCWLV